jgi:hypothetical protein
MVFGIWFDAAIFSAISIAVLVLSIKQNTQDLWFGPMRFVYLDPLPAPLLCSPTQILFILG